MLNKLVKVSPQRPDCTNYEVQVDVDLRSARPLMFQKGFGVGAYGMSWIYWILCLRPVIESTLINPDPPRLEPYTWIPGS